MATYCFSMSDCILGIFLKIWKEKNRWISRIGMVWVKWDLEVPIICRLLLGLSSAHPFLCLYSFIVYSNSLGLLLLTSIRSSFFQRVSGPSICYFVVCFSHSNKQQTKRTTSLKFHDVLHVFIFNGFNLIRTYFQKKNKLIRT